MRSLAVMTVLLFISMNAHALGYCFSPSNLDGPLWSQQKATIMTVTNSGDILARTQAEVYFYGDNVNGAYQVYGVAGQSETALIVGFDHETHLPVCIFGMHETLPIQYDQTISSKLTMKCYKVIED